MSIKLSQLNLNDKEMPLEFVFQSVVNDDYISEYGSIVLSCSDLLRFRNKEQRITNHRGRIVGTCIFNDF